MARKNVAKSPDDSQSPPARPNGARGYDIVTLSRNGAPPLRFKGKQVARHVWSAAPTAAAITLWKSKTRGFVAAVALAERQDAASRSCIEDLMTWLETRCAEPLGQMASGAFPQLGLEHRHLRILAGEALDHWDLIAARDVDDR